MSLDMFGHIDSTFESTTGYRTPITTTYINGKANVVEGRKTPHSVNVQGSEMRQRQTLNIGADRVIDKRTIFVNDGDLYDISPSDLWEFADVPGVFRATKSDNRPWRNYCRLIVSLQND